MESNSSNSLSSKSNQMDSSILQALESLRTIDLSGNKTVNFNTSHDHCSELCESPRLATETCQVFLNSFNKMQELELKKSLSMDHRAK